MATDTGTDDGTGSGQSDDDPPDPPDTGGKGGTDAGENGDGGDSDPELDKWKALARKHEKQAKANAARLAELEEAKLSDTEKAVAQARRETEEQVRSEVLRDRVQDTIEAIAGEKLADPSYSRLLDVEPDDLTSDGKPDRKAIGAALDRLVKAHPELAKAGSKPGALPGGGKRTGNGGIDMNDTIRRLAGKG